MSGSSLDNSNDSSHSHSPDQTCSSSDSSPTAFPTEQEYYAAVVVVDKNQIEEIEEKISTQSSSQLWFVE